MSDDHGHDHHGSRFIQHHYDDAQHQFDSGKLAIWFFLVQEVLFFSALFVAYILYRNHHPEIFGYAHKYLDVKWGAINTVVLIISSLTAAWSVRCAQLGQRKGLIFCLSMTILCACGFLTIKFIEYRHKVIEGELFGAKFDPCHSSGEISLLTKENICEGTKHSDCRAGNIDQDLSTPGWQVDCMVDEQVSHGDKGDISVDDAVKANYATCVMANGKPTNKPCIEHNSLPTCITEKRGDEPPEYKNAPCWDIAQNPWVCKADEVAALVHYPDDERRYSETKIVLTCKDGPKPTFNMDAPLPQSRLPGDAMVKSRHEKTEREEEEEAWLGPPPPHTNMFFSIYFAMTGLHGIHVLVGVFVFIWLLIRAIRGDFTPDYFGPIDYAALYWHLVDLIWIFLFPLLYLIH